MNTRAALFALIMLTSTAHATEPALASCAWVRAENDTAGSGFIVDESHRWLITCRHVVGERAKVDVFFPWLLDGRLITNQRLYLGDRPRLRSLGLLVTGKVLRKSDTADLALIELESLPAGKRAIRFATRPVAIGSLLRVVGNRTELDTLWNITTGPLRARGALINGYSWRGGTLAVNVDALLGQLPIEEGDSGGPVLNDHGELVGMASALRRRAPLAAVAVSLQEIRAFLKLEPTRAIAEPTPPADTLMRATVWIQPNATQWHRAGVLIEENLILTANHGLGSSNRVGVAFPIRTREKWISEQAPYRDPLGLYLRGDWRAGSVIARDPARDLALIHVDSIPKTARPVKWARVPPQPGDPVHAMNHPGGVEFAWVYSAGVVRQNGRVKLADGENIPLVQANLFQLPTQSSSPGGPVLNNRGELLGVLSARESTQLVGYAATTEEIAHFLEIAALARPARTLDGLLARIDAVPRRLARALACVVPSDIAVALDPGCPTARLKRSEAFITLGNPDAAIRELDWAIEQGEFNRTVLMQRARFAIDAQNWRLAHGYLGRILDPFPADAAARLQMIMVLWKLDKDDEATQAITDTLRADVQSVPAIARLLIEQADARNHKYPDSPAVAAQWLERGLQAMRTAPLDENLRESINATVMQARAAKTDAARLTILRGFLVQRAHPRERSAPNHDSSPRR